MNLTSVGRASAQNHSSLRLDTTGYKAVIDSGTSVIIGPKSYMGKLLEGVHVNLDCSGIEMLPKIIFNFDSNEYELEPQDYVLRVKALGKESCVMALMGADLPESFNYFSLGDVFMRRYYTFFNKEKDQLGFFDTKKLPVIQ